jgi:hypothetical protein
MVNQCLLASDRRLEFDGGVSRMNVLLVGEDNPFSADPEFALYSSPDGCSGHRLMKILGLPEDQYLALHRTNLCASGAWSMVEARRRARLLSADRSAPWRTIVLLGRKVADAFDYEQPFFTSGIEPHTTAWPVPITYVSLPHPSGRNQRLWTSGARDRAREILRELAPSAAWGSA